MKSASAGLLAHLAQETTTLAWCWKVTRRDATIFGFTSHDADLVYDGVTYSAGSGFLGSAAQARSGSSVDNMDVQGVLDSSVISEGDLLDGVWDGAEVEVFLLDWADTSLGRLQVQTGSLGQVTLKTGTFIAELRSLSQALQQSVGRTMMRRCNASFADARCGISAATYTVTGSVVAVTDARVFNVSAVPLSAGGMLTWTGGANAGRSEEVDALAAPTVALKLPMPDAVQVGDTYSVIAGCDKNLSTCVAYSNVVNFRGFPHIPGPDAMLSYPDAH